MKRAWQLLGIGCLGTIAVLVLLLFAAPYLITFLKAPHIASRANLLPVGDTMDFQAVQSVHIGNELYGTEWQRTQDDYPGPLARLFKWRVVPPTEGKQAGAASIGPRGLLRGERPGVLLVQASIFGRAGTKEVTILPRITELSVQPAQLELRVGEMARLAFRARLEGNVSISGWSPALWFPAEEVRDGREAVPGGRYGGSKYVGASMGGYHARHADEWWFEVRGKAPGTTTIYLSIGARELEVPVTVLPASIAGDLHADSLAHALLTAPGYQWTTREFEFGHLHALPGTHADTAAETLLSLIEKARARAIGSSVHRDSGPLELFFVDTRSQLQQLAGDTRASKSRPGERTALFLYNETYTPFLVHELTQLYTTVNWGVPASGRWLSAGLGTMVGRYCQEFLSDAARRQLEAGRMRSWPALTRDFEAIDEVDANIQAASMIDYLQRSGIYVRDLWYMNDWPAVERATGQTVTQLDSAWRSSLGNAYVQAEIDRERLYREGCRELE